MIMIHSVGFGCRTLDILLLMCLSTSQIVSLEIHGGLMVLIEV